MKRFNIGGVAPAKPAATKPATKAKPTTKAKAKPTTTKPKRSGPKTTTARGRARTAETQARAAVRAGGGTRATRSLLTAQRARDYYKATGTGTRRSQTGGKGKPANPKGNGDAAPGASKAPRKRKPKG
jgi:hypothetical protein